MSKITVTGQITLTGGQLTAKETPPPPPPAGPSLWTWGRGGAGRLGHGNTTYYSSPTQVGALVDWSVISAGGNGHTLAVKTDGTLWAWGNGYSGALGTGDGQAGSNQSSPVQIGNLTTWSSVAAGRNISFAIKDDGTLFSWGVNNFGQLGLNDTVNRSSPVQVTGGAVWASVNAGGIHCIGVRTNGTLFTWGNDSGGRLGLGTEDVSKSIPSQVGGLNTWASASANGIQTFAVKADGTLFAWGNNNQGQLGLVGLYSRSSPVQVGSGWATVSAGYFFTAAIKTDGTIWSWGRSNEGQLGLGDEANRSSPTQIGALSDWASVDSGEEFTLARKTDSTIWSWGLNGAGRLGVGDTANRSSPVQIGTDTDWTSIVASDHHSVAIKTTT